MKNTPSFPDGFEQWILEKSWEQLSADERRVVEAEGIQEAEYAAIRGMLTELQQIGPEEPVSVSEGLRNKLLEAFDEGPQRKGRVVPIGVWISALTAAAALIVMFIWILPSNPTGAPDVAIKQEAAKPSVEQLRAPTNNTNISGNPESTVDEALPTDVDIKAEPPSLETKNEGIQPAPITAKEVNIAVAEDVAEYSATSSMMEQESITRSNFSSTALSATAPVSLNTTKAEDFVNAKVANNKATINTSLAANPDLLKALVTIY